MRLLLVHGFASSADQSWRDTGWLDVLADSGHEPTAVDLLGHGQSPKPHDPTEYYPGLEDAVAAQVPEAPCAAVGFSLGARTLLVVESRAPGTFERMVVGGYGANMFVPVEEHGGEAIAAVLEGSREPVDPLSRAFRQAALTPPNDPLAMAACMRRSAPPLTEEDLAKVTCPVLVVVGAADPLAVPADRFVAAFPDARLHTIPGVDHLGTMKSFAFLDAVLDFLG